MQTDNKQTAREVFCGVIEQIAFMFAEVAELDDLPAIELPVVEASMSFDGPLRGWLSIAVPADACLQIAANALGMEPENEFVAARATDSLQELLNVTCGYILTSLAGDRPVFDLSIPRISQLDAAGVQALRDAPATVGFVVEGYPLLLRLQIQEG
jgi:hypothetical protein